jgi:glutamine amidotransferase
MINVGIVDYGLGNIASVANALEEAGANVSLVSNQNGISKIDKLVLPGVGSFQSAAFELASKGLDDALREFANRGKPILGICLGMQLFFDEGEELGVSQGLSLIPGRVKKMSGTEFKLPHIGWEKIYAPPKLLWENSLFKNLPQSPEVYFLHSYSAHVTNEEDLLALSKNGQFEFVAAVQHKNIYGCQFHPEKSGRVGLEMLKNFIGI